MSESDAAVLDVFPSPYIAQAVASMLRAEGIPAYVEGANLQDEFAASQRLMGNLTVRVFVPAAKLDEARARLEEAREAGRLMDEGGEETTEEDPEAAG